MTVSVLHDRRILVVEDEYLIAMNLQDNLEIAGSIVVGPAASVEKAVECIQSEPHLDAAVVDVNLGGRLAYRVAELLQDRQIPFVFTSGYEDKLLQTKFPKVKNCLKPYHFSKVEEALGDAILNKRS